MGRDFWAVTNEIENLALEAMRQLLARQPRELTPDAIGDALYVAYSVQATREWREQGGSMLGYRAWQAQLDKDKPAVVAEVAGEAGGTDG